MQTRVCTVSEAIASKDQNNLYITSTFFRDPIKFKAFCAYYAIMRVVDDRIDNLPATNCRSADIKKDELSVVTAWERAVGLSCRGIKPSALLLASCDYAPAKDVFESFIDLYRIIPVPTKLWTDFFSAMRSDIVSDEFVHWTDFQTYAEGATVAPTTIYLSLIVAQCKGKKNSYEIPRGFDLYRAGYHLGLFAYLGHIVRDIALDLTCGSTRICIAREDMEAHGVSLEMLRREALECRASRPTRQLVGELLHRARWHLAQGRALTEPIYDHLGCDGRFILELITTIYEQIISKIESIDNDPMTKRHKLTRLEKSKIILQVADRTGFKLRNRSVVE